MSTNPERLNNQSTNGRIMAQGAMPKAKAHPMNTRYCRADRCRCMGFPHRVERGEIVRTSSEAVKRRRPDKKPKDTSASQGHTIVSSNNSRGILTVDIPSTTVPNSLGTPTGKIRCDECNKVFTKNCYLTQQNKKWHKGEQPFHRNRCGKRSSNETVFDPHYAKHSAVPKPHQCQFCPQQFHHKTDLRRHIDPYLGRKAQVHETCSKRFTKRDHWRKHGDTHKRNHQNR